MSERDRLAHLDDWQALSSRLCFVESVKAWRARVALDLGSWATRVAH